VPDFAQLISASEAELLVDANVYKNTKAYFKA
jgi:hypothetical protein